MKTYQKMVGSIVGLAVVTALAGCSDSAESRPLPTPVDPAVTAPPAGQEDLAQFYSQQPQWQNYADAYGASDVSDRIETAQIQVPIDYDNPALGTTDITLYRQLAADSPGGAIVVNPGGPGGRGQDLVLDANVAFSPEILDTRDIVSFDPRGVDRSNPIVCRTPEQLDATLQQIDGDQTAIDTAVQFRQACADQNAELLSHVDTTSVARDMDIVRAVIGQPLLDYAGLSYGTKLGQRYLSLFPDRAGQFLFDAALEINIPFEQLLRDQAAGLESTFDLFLENYVQACEAGENECELGTDVPTARTNVVELVSTLDAQPLATTDGRSLTGAGLTEMIVYSMYTSAIWPTTQAALIAASQGDGQPALAVTDLFTTRQPDGSYLANSADAYYAINGADHPRSLTVEQIQQFDAELSAISPLFGSQLAWELWQISDWPAQPDIQDAPTSATYSGIPEVLIIGGANDPATPLAWSQATNALLPGSTLVVWEGIGHTATTAGNECINEIVTAFMLEGIVPEQGTVCPA